MKPWLLNLLACPMDKHHPLEAYFFKWFNKPKDIEEILKKVEKGELVSAELEFLAKQVIDGVISKAAIDSIYDLTEINAAHKLLELTCESVKNIISLKDAGVKVIKNSNSLSIFYSYMNLLDVEIGLLFCSKCGRWYPIGSSIRSVPEMLPDELRIKENDLSWMKEWQEKIPQKIKESGKPFCLTI